MRVTATMNTNATYPQPVRCDVCNKPCPRQTTGHYLSMVPLGGYLEFYCSDTCKWEAEKAWGLLGSVDG